MAISAEEIDWRTAAHHYLRANLPDEASRVLSISLESILATGAYASAEELALSLPTSDPTAVVEIIASRTSLQRGDYEIAVSHALSAVQLDSTSDVAVWNAMMVRFTCGQFTELDQYGRRLQELGATQFRRLTAEAVIQLVHSSVDGDLREADHLMLKVAEAALRTRELHFLGVSKLDAAEVRRVRGDADSALGLAREAIDALRLTSAGIELSSAQVVQAWALAHLGYMSDARRVLDEARGQAVRGLEFAFQAADIEALYGSVDRAEELLNPYVREVDPATDVGEQAVLTFIAIDLVRGRLAEAQERLGTLAFGRPSTGLALDARRQATRAYIGLLTNRVGAHDKLAASRQLAEAQDARLWLNYMTVLSMLDPTEPSRAFALVNLAPVYLSMAAECVIASLPLSPDLMQRVSIEALSRPERWRPPLRRALLAEDIHEAFMAGSLLDQIGTPDDVGPLRALARRSRAGVGDPTIGRGLARRLAPHVRVEDLGHVELHIGDRVVPGTDVRRRVLGLLCFLLTRPAMRVQREEVLDALWPELDPASALNSLNQTVYFLRRVFEPSYSDDVSPGYLGQNSEFIWLDQELVTAQSHGCRDLIREATRSGLPTDALLVAQAYRGRFALDFIYEDWAAPYREALHAAYLQVVETSLRSDIAGGHFERGIELAQAAAEVEPDSESLQVALIRLYRLAGAHAAAAEQYGRYASVLKDLGVEPAPLEHL